MLKMKKRNLVLVLHMDVVVTMVPMGVVMVVYQKNLQIKIQELAPVEVAENKVLVAPLAVLVQMHTLYLII